MKLNPYLHFEGNAEEALNFYKDVFKAEITRLSRYKDNPAPTDEDWKEKLLHGRLEFDSNIIMISDGNKGYKPSRDGNIQLSIEVENKEWLQEVWDKLASGGSVTMPLQGMFWGARFGMLTDQFGIKWMLNHELKK